MKRIERQHLKQNHFVNLVNRTTDSVRAHSRGVSAAAVLVVVALLLVGGYFFWRNNRDEKAGAMLADAVATAQAPVAPPAIGTPATAGTFATEEARTQAALPKFIATAEAFPSADAGIEARYRAAATLASLGRYAESIEHYQMVIDRGGSDIHAQTARLGMADAASRAGDHDRAIETLSGMAADATGMLPVDAVLAQLASVYERAGKPGEATATWKRIATEFPDSIFFQEATQKSS